MALLYVSHPPVQTYRDGDIPYFYISWTPEFWSSGPHYKPLFEGAGCTVLHLDELS